MARQVLVDEDETLCNQFETHVSLRSIWEVLEISWSALILRKYVTRIHFKHVR